MSSKAPTEISDSEKKKKKKKKDQYENMFLLKCSGGSINHVLNKVCISYFKTQIPLFLVNIKG